MGNKNSGKWFYKGMSDKEVVTSKIDVINNCWNWNGTIDAHGYGLISRNGNQVKAHRFAYEAFVGSIKNGLCIDHVCRNRKCVNPKHLEVVTLKENKKRGNSPAAINARKTHCKHGHILSDDNIKIYIHSRSNRPWRSCIKCSKIRDNNRCCTTNNKQRRSKWE